MTTVRARLLSLFLPLLSLLWVVPSFAHADGLDALEAFLRGTKSGRADFVQTVTSPAREGQPPRVRTSSGRFEFQRPVWGSLGREPERT